MKRPQWTQEEIDYLASIETLAPAIQTIKRFQQHAHQFGWPPRSKAAIRNKMWERHGTSRRINEVVWTLGQLAEILGFEYARIRTWVNKNKLKTSRVGRLHTVSKKQFRTFARSYPQLLSDAEWSPLAYVLDSDRLATSIKRIPTAHRKLKPIKVYDPSTGKIYPSIRRAAQDLFVAERTIKNWIEKGRLEYVYPPRLVEPQPMEESA